MFGTGYAPDRKNVQKQYNIDPNGVISVSYTDAAGRVIATALEENSKQDVLLPIPSTNEEIALIFESDEATLQAGGYYSSTHSVTHVLPDGTDMTITIEHDFTESDFADVECGNIGGWMSDACDYIIELHVTKTGSAEELILRKINAVGATIDDEWLVVNTGGTLMTYNYTSSTSTVSLKEKGTYNFEKRIYRGTTAGRTTIETRKDAFYQGSGDFDIDDTFVNFGNGNAQGCCGPFQFNTTYTPPSDCPDYSQYCNSDNTF